MFTQARSLFAFRRLVDGSLVFMAPYPSDSARVWIWSKSILSSNSLLLKMEDVIDLVSDSEFALHPQTPKTPWSYEEHEAALLFGDASSCSSHGELCGDELYTLSVSWDYKEGLSRRWAFSHQGQDHLFWSNPTLYIGEVGALRVRTTAMSCVAM